MVEHRKAIKGIYILEIQSQEHTGKKVRLKIVYFDTVSFNPKGRNIFKSVVMFGLVCMDSILATEDCGMPQMAARSR